MNRTIKEFESVKDLVGKLLEDDVRCRDDDKWLIYRVLRHFSPIFIPFEDFSKLPSFETITRIRRKYQNSDNKYKASIHITESRMRKEKEVRGYMLYN